MNHVQLIADGQRWNATYVIKGDEVFVSSAYGGERTAIGKGVDSEAVALGPSRRS
jgi:hypothetical protein